MDTALKTGLKPTFGIKTAKHVSDNLEVFLTAVEKTLIEEAFRRRGFERPNKKTIEIYKVLQKLKKTGSVCVPTDKTNPKGVNKTKE